MKKCLFVTNLPSPYRVDFFNELTKYFDLTVLYERDKSSERDKKWTGDSTRLYKEKYAKVKPYKSDQSKGSGLIKAVKEEKFDFLIITNYASPSVMRLILWCVFNGVDYCLEYDGGFNKKDPILKRFIKRFLITHAKKHIDSSGQHMDYLSSLGVKKEAIFKYNFSSIKTNDILDKPLTKEQKNKIKKNLLITNSTVVLSIGQFIYRKGFDLLIQAASHLPKDIGFYIVGGEPTEEYLLLKEKYNLSNIYFVGFQNKEQLSLFYKCADLFVFPTREDIWGLVINEAMSYGLPVVSSDRCIAALEMIKPGENGYLFKSENVESLVDKLRLIIKNSNAFEKYGESSLRVARKYTIEEMALSHKNIFDM